MLSLKLRSIAEPLKHNRIQIKMKDQTDSNKKELHKIRQQIKQRLTSSKLDNLKPMRFSLDRNKQKGIGGLDEGAYDPYQNLIAPLETLKVKPPN